MVMAKKLLLLFSVALLLLVPGFSADEADHKDQRDEGPPKKDEHHPDGNEHRPKQKGDGPKGNFDRPWRKRGDHDHDHDQDHHEKDGRRDHGRRDRHREGHDNMWIRRSCKIRAVIIAGVLIFIMLVVFLGCCVYRKRNAAKETEVKTIPKVFIEPSPNTMTVANSKLPMKKLVNEA